MVVRLFGCLEGNTDFPNMSDAWKVFRKAHLRLWRSGNPKAVSCRGAGVFCEETARLLVQFRDDSYRLIQIRSFKGRIPQQPETSSKNAGSVADLTATFERLAQIEAADSGFRW